MMNEQVSAGANYSRSGMTTDWIPVMGGSLDRQRVRWQGSRLFAPKPLPLAVFTPADAQPEPIIPEYEAYEAWVSEGAGGRCYIEVGLARQIEADRKREQTLNDLRDTLAGVLPNPSQLMAVHMKGEVWWCGDEVCDCYQAQIVGWDYVIEGWRIGYRLLWGGSFHSDGESAVPYREIRACRDFLRLVVPSVAAQIRWAMDE